ncbi:MAG TPA: glycine cleavage system aminomethyltransferase GcvT, partial [Acidimicrobiia bacterium]
MAQTLRRTPLHARHVALGARMVPFAGWEMPVQYEGVIQEHRAVRADAGAFDVSHMGELVMAGEYAAQVVNYLITNDARSLTDGQALYTCACNE